MSREELYDQLRRASVDHHETVLKRVMNIAGVSSPTGEEHQRAEYVASQFKELGYEPEIDDISNVYVRRGNKGGKAVMLLAHIDTVFPAETEINITRDDEYMYGPGIGDNASNVAGMLTALQILDEHNVETPVDIIAVGNVGEEGLGNLRGARQAVDRYRDQLGAVIVLDGRVGRVVNEAVGSERWRVTVNGPGGHSFNAFGLPSAIHGLGRIIAAIADLKVPEQPTTTYNVGTIEGGNSVNSIAASASALVDMRSVGPDELKNLVDQVKQIVETKAGDGLEATYEVLGQRPTGAASDPDPVVEIAKDTLRWLGYEPTSHAASTDMNIPISYGIPAVCIGVSEGEQGHTTNERMKIEPFKNGVAQFCRTIIAVSDWAAENNK